MLHISKGGNNISQQKIDFRGGKREGAGRKKLGETRRVSLTLPTDWWETIDSAVASGRKQTDVIREIMHNTLGNGSSYNAPASKNKK